MYKEGTRRRGRDKEVAEDLVEGTRKLVNRGQTETSSEEIGERADNLHRYSSCKYRFSGTQDEVSACNRQSKTFDRLMEECLRIRFLCREHSPQQTLNRNWFDGKSVKGMGPTNLLFLEGPMDKYVWHVGKLDKIYSGSSIRLKPTHPSTVCNAQGKKTKGLLMHEIPCMFSVNAQAFEIVKTQTLDTVRINTDQLKIYGDR